jgi:antitoxin component YwqK of YwqJK toxin-antitoxin module
MTKDWSASIQNIFTIYRPKKGNIKTPALAVLLGLAFAVSGLNLCQAKEATAPTTEQPQSSPEQQLATDFTKTLLTFCKGQKDGMSDFKHEMIKRSEAQVYCKDGKFEKFEVYQNQQLNTRITKDKIVEGYINGKLDRRLTFDNFEDVQYFLGMNIPFLFRNKKVTSEDFYPNETIKRRTLYDYGKGFVEFYDETGTLYAKGDLLKGQQLGKLEEYYENGAIRTRRVYVNNQMEGPWEEYYEDGTLKTRGSYAKNLQDGVWETFSPAGKLKMREHYKNGQKDGKFELFYDNGNLEVSADFVAGQLNGVIETHAADGTILRQITFKDGKAVSGKIFNGSGIPAPISQADLDYEFHQNGK